MYKLLIVDDEDFVREAVASSMVWQQENITLVGSCGDALSALDCMTDERPDILLTDVKMPVMDGLQLIERAQELYAPLCCIVLSGFEEFAFARRAMSLGVKHYLLKPFSDVELLRALRASCREIDRQRREDVQDADGRCRLAKELAQELATLSCQYGEQLDSGLIRQAEQKYDTPGLLSDALVRLVSGDNGAASAEEKLLFVEKAFDPSVPIWDHAARYLRRRAACDHTGSCVEQMEAYIHRHYQSSGLTLQSLAENVVHMNPDYLGKLFLQQTGKRFCEYLLEVRMEHAMRIIASVEESRIYEVADQVGLGHNPKYFSHVFKKYTGMTPKDYRVSATDKMSNI